MTNEQIEGMPENAMLDTGLTVAEQRAYNDAHKHYQYDDECRLSERAQNALKRHHAAEWARIVRAVEIGILTHGEADKRGNDLLAGG